MATGKCNSAGESVRGSRAALAAFEELETAVERVAEVCGDWKEVDGLMVCCDSPNAAEHDVTRAILAAGVRAAIYRLGKAAEVLGVEVKIGQEGGGA